MTTVDPTLTELRRISRLLAVMYASDDPDKKQSEKVTELSRAGFSPKEIAEILGTTANTVNVALVRSRKKGMSR